MNLDLAPFFPFEPPTTRHVKSRKSDSNSSAISAFSTTFSFEDPDAVTMRAASDLSIPDHYEGRSATVSIHLSSRAGQVQTLVDVPDNHRFIRPDDTIHLHLQPSRDIIIVLSDSFDRLQQTHSRWLGQFNGREEFKVSHLRHYDDLEVYHLAFTANSSWLEYRVSMGTPLVSINGHLAISLDPGKPMQFALSLPPQSRLTPGFMVAASLVPMTTQYWQEAPVYLSLYDCLQPLRFTTQHARRRTLTRNKSSASTFEHLRM